MNVFEQARQYLELGFSVIPIQAGKKIPTGEWKQFQEKRMEVVDIPKFFKEGDNIALVCGDISRVLVIDNDSYKERVLHLEIELVSPLCVLTPRGGKHIYFRYVEGTGNTANQELAIDIRSSGGYVLIPPSTVTQENGDAKSYSWNTAPTKEIIDKLSEVPPRVLEVIYRKNQSHNVLTNGKAFLDVSEVMSVGEGGRNNSLSAYSLSALNSTRGDQQAAWNLVVGMNQTYKPPLDESEIKTVFNSALKKYTESPPPQRNTPQRTPKRPLNEIKTFKKTSTSQDYENALKVFLEGKTKGIPTGFPRLDNLTGGFLPGQSYLLYADTNVGKSVFAVNMIVDMAKRGVKCLYFDLENSMEMTMERLMFVAADGKVNLTDWRAAVEEKNTEEIIKSMSHLKDILADIYVWDLNKLNDRFGEILWEGVSRCVEEGVEQGVQVVIIDHLHYFAPSETDHSVLGEISRQLNNMCAIHNISILLVAHTRKGLTHADRTGKVTASRPTLDFINGSGMISKHFKNIIALKRNVVAVDPAERCETSVYVDKTKYGPSGYFNLRYDESTLRFIDEDIPRTVDAFEKKQEETDKAKTEKDRLVDLFMSPSEEDGNDDEIESEDLLKHFDE